MVRYLRVKKFRKKKNAQPEVEQPKLMMDIIAEEYPEKYDTLKEKISQLGRMFTQEEWLTILMRSRAEHERFLPKKGKREPKD